MEYNVKVIEGIKRMDALVLADENAGVWYQNKRESNTGNYNK